MQLTQKNINNNAINTITPPAEIPHFANRSLNRRLRSVFKVGLFGLEVIKTPFNSVVAQIIFHQDDSNVTDVINTRLNALKSVLFSNDSACLIVTH